MRHIGILAHSADGAALCFLEVVREGARMIGAHEHPEITLSILPMASTFASYDRGDFAAVNAHLMRSCQRLADAGCDFFVCPDNTAHLAFEAARAPFPLPGLHIADIVAQEARAEGFSRVGLLGTRWTMEGSVYPAAFARAGVCLRAPEPGEREIVDRVIFDELCQGVIEENSRTAYIEIIARMRGDGCDAVALSCTEIPLLVTPEHSPLPTLDSTRLLASAALHVAMGLEPMPSWRGGAPN